MRLIDVNKLKENLTTEIYSYSKGDIRKRLFARGLSLAYDIVNRQPTVEPKHGHWITWFENKDVRQAKCSECGMMFTLGKGRDIHYCGNCGAKMDEVLNVPLRNGKSTMELERLMDEVKEDG